MLEGYAIIDYLKKGTYSDVLKIQDKKTKEYYVAKIVKNINTPLYRVLFDREVGALTKLRACENIVELEHYDFAEYEEYGQCGFIYLQYIDGNSLDNIDVFSLINSDKYYIIEQLINAIQVAHDNNIIHRDINPKNIILYNKNQVKLIDFGISKIKDMVNNDTVYRFATNRYAAPEVQAHNENATVRSDIYSLGAVIYFLFTGNEPPLCNEVEEELKCSGIDVELRTIIMKMMSEHYKNRYEDIFEVKKDILKFLGKMKNKNNKCIIRINTDKIRHMKEINLVPKEKSYEDILKNELKSDFIDAYITLKDIDEEDEEQQYIFFGDSIQIQCFYNKQQQLFLAYRINKLHPNIRETMKKKSMKIDGLVEFVMYNNKQDNNNVELLSKLKDFKIRLSSEKNINNEYYKNYFAWSKLLEIIEDDSKNNAIKVDYKSVSIDGKDIVLEITEEDYYILDSKDTVDSDMMFVIEKEKYSKKTAPIKLGAFDSLDIKDGKYYLRIVKNQKISINKIPKKGVASEDYRKKMRLVNREIKAISQFNNEDYIATSRLKGIFSEILDASSFNNPEDIKYFNQKLDPSQKNAIKKVLNSKDIALIQGPPGTGKTSVIIEIIRQIVKYSKKGDVFKKKILLVSQAHAAVDKMLEDLYECGCDDLKIVRIGREEHLSNLVKNNYSIDKLQDIWVKKVQQRCCTKKNIILESLDIDINEFEKYKSCILVENTDEQLNTIKVEFEKKYKDRIKTKEFKGLLVQQQWVDRIQGDLELEKYYVKNSNIVAGTCTGFVSNNAINNMIFDYLIVDEAAKATFPELIIPIIRSKKIVLVGDHKQLPPILKEDLIRSSKHIFEESNIDYKTLYTGLFYKLFTHVKLSNKQVLLTQYRMHPTIGSLVGQMFYKEEQISNGVTAEQRIHTIEKYKGLAVVWISTSKCTNRNERKNGKEKASSYSNLLEANIVREQLELISLSSKGEQNVGVITPYSAQKNLIKNQIRDIDMSNFKNKIPVNSVDAFQGSQNDIIIYSTVRSNRTNTIGFLSSQERLNVAFSRAKKLLIIIGDKDFLQNWNIPNNRFPEILSYIKDESETCRIINYNYEGRK